MSKSIFSSSNITVKTVIAKNPIIVKTDPIPVLSDELKYIQVLITCPAVAYLIDVLEHYYSGDFQYVLAQLQTSELTSLTTILWGFRKVL